MFSPVYTARVGLGHKFTHLPRVGSGQ